MITRLLGLPRYSGVSENCFRKNRRYFRGNCPFGYSAVPAGSRRHTVRILLLIAKKMITVNWKDAEPTTITERMQRLKQNDTMELMTASPQMKMVGLGPGLV